MQFFSVKDTQCFVAHNDQFVVLAFRGTEMDNFHGAIMDWALDLEFKLVPDESGGLVHDGFQEGINDIWPAVKPFLQTLLSDGRGRTLWVTGHSLGAALATVGAERVRRDGNFEVRGVYTYGAPRVGDAGFAKNYSDRGLNDITYRFVYDVDVVSKVPPPILYTHVGKLKYFDSAGHLHELERAADAGLEPQLPSNTRSWLLQLSFLGHASVSLLVNPFKIIIPAPLADHAPIYYACYAWNNV
jgi:triacylglycerol lipase